MSVDNNDIDDCHRHRDKEQKIVQFPQRKYCKQALQCKKDVPNVNMNNIDLPERTKLFINESLCPQYKGLWIICKILRNRKRMHSFFTANVILKFCLEEHEPLNIVTH